jgi:hypothetical protein
MIVSAPKCRHLFSFEEYIEVVELDPNRVEIGMGIMEVSATACRLPLPEVYEDLSAA